jgi:hypothetical protein
MKGEGKSQKAKVKSYKEKQRAKRGQEKAR